MTFTDFGRSQEFLYAALIVYVYDVPTLYNDPSSSSATLRASFSSSSSFPCPVTTAVTPPPAGNDLKLVETLAKRWFC